VKLVSDAISHFDHFGWVADIHCDNFIIGVCSKDSACLFGWDSIWSQQEKFAVSKNGSLDPYYGHAFSIHENMIVVGVDTKGGISGLTGSAYVYVQDSDEAWQESKIKAIQSVSLCFSEQFMHVQLSFKPILRTHSSWLG
jgi:hypothetical protein